MQGNKILDFGLSCAMLLSGVCHLWSSEKLIDENESFLSSPAEMEVRSFLSLEDREQEQEQKENQNTLSADFVDREKIRTLRYYISASFTKTLECNHNKNKILHLYTNSQRRGSFINTKKNFEEAKLIFKLKCGLEFFEGINLYGQDLFARIEKEKGEFFEEKIKNLRKIKEILERTNTKDITDSTIKDFFNILFELHDFILLDIGDNKF